MWFFNKKPKKEQEKQVIIEPTPCRHKWKDFDWYLEINYDNTDERGRYQFHYKVVEPYVCILCHERRNIVLDEGSNSNCTTMEMSHVISDLKEKLPQLKHRALVENDIHDFIMVDRDYLKILDSLKNPTDSVPKLKT